MEEQESQKVKKHICIGLLAHVDAGKTTFTEQLLRHAGVLQKAGRVDYGSSFMDTDEIEKRRGITIFSGLASFFCQGLELTILDTPGHADFSAETERVISVLDYAVLLLSGTEGVEAHTITLYRMLERYRVPTFFFINKLDNGNADLQACLEEIRERLTKDGLFFGGASDSWDWSGLFEFAADRDEGFLEEYLAWMEEGDKDGRPSIRELCIKSLKQFIGERKCFPIFGGSALKDQGILAFLQSFAMLAKGRGAEDGAELDREEQKPFVGRIYQIRYDDKGNRQVFVKAEQGRLRVKGEFTFQYPDHTVVEKVQEIRRYQGKSYTLTETLEEGQIAALTGLHIPKCGDGLYQGEPISLQPADYCLKPVMRSRVIWRDGTDFGRVLSVFRILEEEEPALSLSLSRDRKALYVHVMGKIQLEVLTQMVWERFSIQVEFERPNVDYLETIEKPVVGRGHFEPLRHYAEVKLRLEPAPRGSGITFDSQCHVDKLARNFQSLIRTHIMEKQHKGILTGSPVTDLRIVLLDGRAHIKHTEGGDFREAVYRAVRQGLEKAENVLLEPMYRLEAYCEREHYGRLMSDVQKRRGVLGAPIVLGNGLLCRVEGRGPAAEFMDYAAEFASYTKGRGSLSMSFDGYDRCSNTDEVIEAVGYEKDRDLENPSSSVFCAKGTSFVARWDEADAYMHCE